ncbi:MAG: hypothetical protein ABWY26_07405 [Microbacterium sp.]
MDTADSRHLSRLSKLLLVSAGVAFAWVLLSLTLGLSASQAHADDGGLLGDAADIVDDGATAVTGIVSHTGAAAVEVVAPVIQPVVQPIENIVQPVASAVEPVISSTPAAPVVEVVGSVVVTVADIPGGGIVSPLTDTVLGVVETVPVVDGLVSGLGVDAAVSSVGSSVDGVLQGGTKTVVDTVSGIVGPVGGTLIDPPVPPLTRLVDPLLVPAVGAGTNAAVNPLEMLARAAYLAGATASLSLGSDLSAALSSPDDAFVSNGAVGGIFALLRAVMQADSVLMGPGGAGPGAWVLVALGLVVAYRAWMRRSGLENDVAPPAPVLATDDSPD